VALFADAEASEFQRRDLNAAAGLYRGLAQSSKTPVRAAALVRLGRVRRQLGDRTGALQVYSSLEQLGSVTVGGQPAGLVGWQGRCRVLDEARDVEGLRGEAVKLAQARFRSWPVDQPRLISIVRWFTGRAPGRRPAAQSRAWKRRSS
jgi:hypothetical protein